jgi:hypothetical protein
MSTQTVTAERQELYRMIDALSDDRVVVALDFVRGISDETPNAETIAAIVEARAGLDEPTTLEEILSECHALSTNSTLV